MDHVAYVDAKEKELERLLSGEKKMIVRGATGRKLPYGRVQAGDRLYLIENNGTAQVKAAADVSAVFQAGPLSEAESRVMIESHQEQLCLSPKQVERWAGKRYLVLISVSDVETVESFSIDRSAYGNMDDWLPVGSIETVQPAR